nr:hypothetical protein [Tanacetum cinerariifolium]
MASFYFLDIESCTMVSLRSQTLTCNMRIDMIIAMLKNPLQFCLHGIMYESKYYKSCMGRTCNRRIDMIIAMLTKPVTFLFTWDYV